MDTEENTNDLIYAETVVVTKELGLRGRKGSHPKEPMWKRRLESQIKGLRRDLSRVEALLQGRSLEEYHRGELERKYKISENGLKHVSEGLKQRITAKATKIQKYQNRNKQFQQNRLFETAQRKFMRGSVSGVKNHCEPIPDAEMSKQFWGNIWDEESPCAHRSDADCLKKLKEEVKVTQHYITQSVTTSEKGSELDGTRARFGCKGFG